MFDRFILRDTFLGFDKGSQHCLTGDAACLAQSLENKLEVLLLAFFICSLLFPHLCSPQMASHAHCRGHNMPLSQPTRLEAPGSRLKGVTPDSARRREDLRVAEPIHDDNVREGRDDWDSSDGNDSRWRHGEVAGGSDSGSDGMNVNSLDVSGLLEEYVWL
jgi:hypothetical protein